MFTFLDVFNLDCPPLTYKRDETCVASLFVSYSIYPLEDSLFLL